MIKICLISQVSLPYSHIGSWTTLYQNYFDTQSGIHYIICPRSQKEYEGIEYSFVKETFFDKVQRKFLKKKKLEYLSAIRKIIKKDQKYIFQLVDDYGMVKPLNDFLVKSGIREKSYIQFFYHGFDPYPQFDSYEKFYSLLDEIVVLTHSSREAFKNKIAILPPYFSVLNNGIDTSKFRVVPIEEKVSLKESLGFGDKTVFLWCSQDRPKKGLHIILEAWSKMYSSEKNILLIVIGCEHKENSEDVRYLGKIPNNELPKYYQAADCYLFSTLCQEGFGLSLIEALHCGCYCIASKLGGVPEVLQWGKYGKLIDNPHFVEEWVDAITEFLEGKLTYPSLPKELYSTEAWNVGMNNIIEEAKRRLDNRTAP